MKKCKKLLSIILVICIIFSFSLIVSADTPSSAGSAEISLKLDNLSVNAGDTVQISIVTSKTSFPAKRGTVEINLPDSKLATIGDVTGGDGITWKVDGSKFNFEIANQRVLNDGEVIGKINVTFTKDSSGSIVEFSLKEASMMTWDTSAIDCHVVATAVKVNVGGSGTSNNPTATGAKIVLASKINNISDITVEFVAGSDEPIKATPTLSDDGKEISVATDAALKDGTEYTVVVKGAGYLTSNTTKFTPVSGAFGFNITDFIPGDADQNSKINFTDFNYICTAYADKTADAAADLNKDGKVSMEDINIFIASWINGGTK